MRRNQPTVESLENAFIIFDHGIKADDHARNDACNQLDRADDHKKCEIRLLKNQKEHAKHDHGKPDDQRSQANEPTERLSVLFGHAVSMIPMKRRDIPRHIDNAERANQKPKARKGEKWNHQFFPFCL